MVAVVSQRTMQSGTLASTSGLTQLVLQAVRSQLAMVESFEHRIRHILIKHIETINALSAFLDGRTVCPPTVPVVFPSQIVFTRSIHTSPRRETVVGR